MIFIKPLTNIKLADVREVGGKAAMLGELTRLGFSVPPGFVVSVKAYKSFLEFNGLQEEISSIINRVEILELAELVKVSRKILVLFKKAKLDRTVQAEVLESFKILGTRSVAVRSSATAEDGVERSWAGVLGSYLAVNETELVGKIKRCWESFFSPRAIYYRLENKTLGDEIAVGVVVQKMAAAELSGTAFSIHPATGNRNKVVIESVMGLGEPIVSGLITPDYYEVDKESKKIVSRKIIRQEKKLTLTGQGNKEWKKVGLDEGEKEKITAENLEIITSLAMKLEEYFRFPCDIEWIIERGRLQILQCRPIKIDEPDGKI